MVNHSTGNAKVVGSIQSIVLICPGAIRHMSKLEYEASESLTHKRIESGLRVEWERLECELRVD